MTSPAPLAVYTFLDTLLLSPVRHRNKPVIRPALGIEPGSLLKSKF